MHISLLIITINFSIKIQLILDYSYHYISTLLVQSHNFTRRINYQGKFDRLILFFCVFFLFCFFVSVQWFRNVNNFPTISPLPVIFKSFKLFCISLINDPDLFPLFWDYFSLFSNLLLNMTQDWIHAFLWHLKYIFHLTFHSHRNEEHA